MRRALIAVLLLAAATQLFADASLSVTPATTPSRHLAGAHGTFNLFTIRNNGPDAATGVKLALTSAIPFDYFPDLGTIQAFERREVFVDFIVPTAAGSYPVTATVTANNAAPATGTRTLEVSTDPDVVASLDVPFKQDLGVPFRADLYLANPAFTIAHDVVTTLDFPATVAVQSLPAGCTSPFAGRVVCRLDELRQTLVATRFFSLTLVAPATFGNGTVPFTISATERETDFDPGSNARSATVGLYDTVYVTTTANDGSGSLRAAIDAVNACNSGGPCTIGFRIAEPSPSPAPWKTIRVTTPLPAVRASNVRIAGATQTGLLGDTNPDGPEVEISGGGMVDADGLVLAGCSADVAGLAVGGFGGNGISVAPTAPCLLPESVLHDLYVGTDPTGTAASPNLRGIGTNVGNGTSVFNTGQATTIRDSVISGNRRSGVFGLSGRLNLSRNRIGVKARADEPLPNGNAGVYIGPGGYGSDVGAGVLSVDYTAPSAGGNVIAFNGQMGVAVAAGVADVAIRHNRIFGNGGIGIDIGLDGPASAAPAIPAPVLTLAHYDPAANQTVIEGDVSGLPKTSFSPAIDFFAGEGARPLGTVRPAALPHFRFTVDGDLTGERIVATTTRYDYLGIESLSAQGIDQLILTQTSEFSRAIEVR